MWSVFGNRKYLLNGRSDTLLPGRKPSWKGFQKSHFLQVGFPFIFIAHKMKAFLIQPCGIGEPGWLARHS